MLISAQARSSLLGRCWKMELASPSLLQVFIHKTSGGRDIGAARSSWGLNWFAQSKWSYVIASL